MKSPMFVDAAGQSDRIVCQPHAMICACVAAVLVALSWTLITGHTGAMLELDVGHWTLSLSLSLSLFPHSATSSVTSLGHPLRSLSLSLSPSLALSPCLPSLPHYLSCVVAVAVLLLVVVGAD